MNCGVFVPKINWSQICVFPLRHARKSLDLDSFRIFWKTKDIFNTIFDVIYNMLRLFFHVLSRGVTNYFSLKPPKTDRTCQLSQYPSTQKMRI